MNILILGHKTPGVSPAYQGTQRINPYYVDTFDEDHHVNQCFLWYCREGGETGLVHNLAKARSLISAYQALVPPQDFELVQVAKDRHHKVKGEFLGFDLSAGYNFSLLSWGLGIGEAKIPSSLKNDRLMLIQPLLRLVQDHFQNKLNSNGLFDNLADARYCLSCMMALQGLYPGLWENEEVIFEPVALWKLDNI